MLKGFLILVFISSAIGLIALQVTKPAKQPASKVSESTEKPLDVNNLVFYDLVKPEDQSNPQNLKNKTTSSTTCTTDLECETTVRVSSFDLEIPSKPEKQKKSEDAERHQEPSLNNEDAIEQVINKQQSEDEILDLIDNLADLQQKIEDNK